MAIGNYSELQVAVARWLKRSNLADSIPDFITLAEAQLNRDLRVRQMTAVYTRTTDQHIIALPDEYLAAEKLELNGQKLTYTNRFDASSGSLDSITGDDLLYTTIGNNVWLITAVAAESVFKLYFYERLTPLSDEEPQNWLIEDAPDAYLFGALIQAEPYLKNDPRLALWQGQYQGVIGSMNTANAAARTSGSALVMRSA